MQTRHLSNDHMPEIKQNTVSKTVKDAATAKGHAAGCTWACLSVCVCVCACKYVMLCKECIW